MLEFTKERSNEVIFFGREEYSVRVGKRKSKREDGNQRTCQDKPKLFRSEPHPVDGKVALSHYDVGASIRRISAAPRRFVLHRLIRVGKAW